MDNFKKMSKEQIVFIATNILNDGDIIAKHGTSINNAFSIMSTGFNFDRTSYVMEDTKNITTLCTYGWKENIRGDAANVIIEVPKKFIMDLHGISEDEYNDFISHKAFDKEDYLRELTDTKVISEGNNNSIFKSPPVIKSHIPVQFIRGTFIYCDEKNYSDFSNNKEEGLNHLTYIENENFYNNLNFDLQVEFVNEMRQKLGLEPEVHENKI